MRFRILSALLLSLAGTPLLAQENYSLWAGSSLITVNTTPSGADIGYDYYSTSTVANFPLLVRLTPAQAAIFAHSGPHGEDIRFAKMDGTPLTYQIERWDSASQRAEIWVRMDVPTNAQTDIRMYWGKGGAYPYTNGPGVFGGSNGFLGAWHMGAPDPFNNRANSAGGNPAVPTGNAGRVSIRSTEGAIGLADSLRGNGTGGSFLGDHFDLGDGFGTLGNDFTLSLWVKPTQKTVGSSSRALVTVSNGGGTTCDDNVSIAQKGDFAISGKTGNTVTSTSAGVITPSEWQLLTFTYSTNMLVLARNGSVVKQIVGSEMPTIARTLNYIGRSCLNGDSTFQGLVDEVTISKVERDPNWIKLAYETQKPGTQAVRFKDPERALYLTGPLTDGLRTDGMAYQTVLDYRDGMEVKGVRYDSARFARGTYTSDSIEIDWKDLYNNPSFRINIKPDSLTLTEYRQGFYEEPTLWSQSVLRPDRIQTPHLSTPRATADTVEADRMTVTTSLAATNLTADHITTESLTASEVVTTPKWEVIPDYVFEKGYARKSLSEVEAFVQDKKHLPGMPSARQIADKGMSLTEMNLNLLRAVEELTLHVIDINKELEVQKKRNLRLEQKVADLKTGRKGKAE